MLEQLSRQSNFSLTFQDLNPCFFLAEWDHLKFSERIDNKQRNFLCPLGDIKISKETTSFVLNVSHEALKKLKRVRFVIDLCQLRSRVLCSAMYVLSTQCQSFFHVVLQHWKGMIFPEFIFSIFTRTHKYVQSKKINNHAPSKQIL